MIETAYVLLPLSSTTINPNKAQFYSWKSRSSGAMSVQLTAMPIKNLWRWYISSQQAPNLLSSLCSARLPKIIQRLLMTLGLLSSSKNNGRQQGHALCSSLSLAKTLLSCSPNPTSRSTIQQVCAETLSGTNQKWKLGDVCVSPFSKYSASSYMSCFVRSSANLSQVS